VTLHFINLKYVPNAHAFFKAMVVIIQILTMLGLRDSLILMTATTILKEQQ
jgi:hypothetical protein